MPIDLDANAPQTQEDSSFIGYPRIGHQKTIPPGIINLPEVSTEMALKSLLLALSISVSASSAFAQRPSSAAPAYAYDVVSIHQNKTESENTDITIDHNRFSATNVTFKQLLEVAYNIREDMISGISCPVESARFDVEAKVLPPDSGAPPRSATNSSPRWSSHC